MKKKVLGMCLILSMVVSGVSYTEGQNAKAAGTIGSLHYGFSSLTADSETSGNNTDYTLKKTKYGSKGEGYHFTTGSGILYASIDGSSKRKLEWSEDTYQYNGSKLRQPVMTAGKKNPWKAGTKPYFEVQFSTSGYESVSFEAYLGATKKGPKQFQAAYAVGNKDSYTNLSGGLLSLSENKKMQKLSVALPKDAWNQSQVKIRIFIPSLKAFNGNSLIADATSGEAAINHISVSGTKKTNTVASVTKVSLSKTELTLKKGKSVTLKATISVSPASASKEEAKKKLVWTSSDEKTVSVSKTGKIKAKKKGSAVITVSYSEKKKASCKVTVK